MISKNFLEVLLLARHVLYRLVRRKSLLPLLLLIRYPYVTCRTVIAKFLLAFLWTEIVLNLGILFSINLRLIFLNFFIQ